MLAAYQCLLATIMTIDSYQPPTDVHLVNVNSSYLAFRWSPVSSTCHAIHYLISSSNCGHCPNTTNNTMATCTGMFTGIQVCSFTLQTVVCDSFIRNESREVIATLKGMLSYVFALVHLSWNSSQYQMFHQILSLLFPHTQMTLRSCWDSAQRSEKR